ncbi:hypothetical protein GALMADRAFT_1112139 [Galerina marginata CBS 339.88]|uniref:Uncharacterized protein n=1 Tax=Galerina marginata (strain CBS 339.88) TaxID=685588 RepID=A0A067TCI4_GALM3|nr:hypothetical protein GALMADRAFT_1112139 [Galerina marginata CBS 339.88]
MAMQTRKPNAEGVVGPVGGLGVGTGTGGGGGLLGFGFLQGYPALGLGRWGVGGRGPTVVVQDVKLESISGDGESKEETTDSKMTATTETTTDTSAATSTTTTGTAGREAGHQTVGYGASTLVFVALIAFLIGSLLRSLLSPADFIYVVTDRGAATVEEAAAAGARAVGQEGAVGGWREIRRLVEVKYLVGGWDFQVAAVRRH